jgi:hypothetical protein
MPAAHFLHVATCYGGSNVFLMQTLNLEFAKQDVVESKELSPNIFIEAIEGLPGYTVTGVKKAISDFNININNFFEKEKNSIINSLKSNPKISKEKINYILKNITDLQILTGKIQTPDKPGAYNVFNLSPILVRNENIKQSPEFLKIFQDFVIANAQNIPRIKFPGQTEMPPLKEVFPDLVPKAKRLLIDILEKKENQLKEIIAKILDYKTSLAKFEAELPEANLDEYRQLVSILEVKAKNETKILGIQISDIKKYMSQL